MTSSRVFQTGAATIGKARSPTMDRFSVGMANVFHDHERMRSISQHLS